MLFLQIIILTVCRSSDRVNKLFKGSRGAHEKAQESPHLHREWIFIMGEIAKFLKSGNRLKKLCFYEGSKIVLSCLPKRQKSFTGALKPSLNVRLNLSQTI